MRMFIVMINNTRMSVSAPASTMMMVAPSDSVSATFSVSLDSRFDDQFY